MRIAGLLMVGVVLTCGTPGGGAADPRPGGGTATAWGKPVDGLQAGLRPATKPQRVTSGVVAEFEVVIRNVQDRGAVLLSYPAGTWYSGTADKGVVALGAGGIAGRPIQDTVQLKPDEEVVVGRVFLGLPGAKPAAGHLIELPAGKYRVGSEGVLPSPKLAPPNNVPVPGVRYCPELRTGYLDMELQPSR
ncbi:hypothetical protein J8F10_12445 [Gemmata sp. G18]|uniref:Secreted protein n=1 Tax=Gemmata palustris TaxID=2822762 RepID=A0ABS5BQT7_9BACT|nr:hypothetical protein [Gemmata palustris]MBP3956092.1 hypothetical protein [Gemmata palustris]